jgi:hypothetical protein
MKLNILISQDGWCALHYAVWRKREDITGIASSATVTGTPPAITTHSGPRNKVN